MDEHYIGLVKSLHKQLACHVDSDKYSLSDQMKFYPLLCISKGETLYPISFGSVMHVYVIQWEFEDN